jgi:hypothetical protein
MGTNSGTTWTRVSDSDTSAGGLAELLRTADVHTGRLAIGPTGALFVALGAAGQPIYVGFTLDQGQHWTPMDVPVFLANSPQPTSPSNIVRITRGGVAGGQATTILVDTGITHHLSGSSRVRLVGLPTIPNVNNLNGDWIAATYKEPQPGGGTTDSTTKFILQSRLNGHDGDGTTSVFDVSNTGTWQFWQGTNPGGQAGTNLALAVDPTDPKFVYIGGDAGAYHLLRGDSSQPTSNAVPTGQWTTLVNGGAADGRDIHADLRDIILDPTGQFIYVCSDGGVFVRPSPRDASGSWLTMAGDLMSAEFRSIALDPLSHAILGGTQDNGSPSELQPSIGAPLPWSQIEFADGVAVAAVDAHKIDPATELPISYRYTSFQGSNDFELHTFDMNGVKLNTELLIDPNNPSGSKLVVSGSSPVQHLNDVENFDWLAAIGVNRVFDQNANPQPNPENWLLIAGHKQGVWESRDLGETIALVSGSPINARYFSYGSASNIEALWVAAENGCCGSANTTIYSRLAAGESLNLEAVFTTSGNGATAVAMSTSNPGVAYVTTDSRVLQLTHGNPGPAPVDVTGDLALITSGPWQGAGRLRSIVYVPSAAHGDRLFVSAADGGVPGVFMMAVDNPGVWTRIGTNLPNANPWALDYDPGNDMLVVGTAGRGAWSLLGASTLDRAPKALCRDLTLSADATCHATTTPAAFNNGSVDPDGNPLTFTAVDSTTLAPITLSPFALGTFPLTIDVADNQGASALCRPNLTVRDTTPPALQLPPARSVTTCADAVTVSIGQATATDNCAAGLVPTGQVISKNGVLLNPPIPVVNGQATLGPGTYVVRWTVSDGVNPPSQANQSVTVAAAIEVSQTFLLDDRARLLNATGGFAAMLNSGTGSTRVGQDGRTAGIISRAPVTVQHRAIVNGGILSGSTVTVDADATVTGTITRNASVSLPALPALPPFPPATLAGFTVNAGQTQTRPPGSYAGGTFVNGGTLILQAGDYFFQSLTINAGSTIRVPTGTRVFVRDALSFQSPFLGTSGTALQSLTLGFAGTTVSLLAPFNGTLLAPNASVTFGTGAGLTYRGQFFGRSFEVTPASTLVCAP